MSESWLDCLAQHPIFELTAEEKKYADSFKAKQTQTNNFSQHSSVIALREDSLYFAVKNRVRVLSLNEFKDNWRRAKNKALQNKSELDMAWIHSVPYKILETPDINFNIENIIINKQGRLLAAIGENKLTVICLPRGSYISSIGIADRYIDCRTLSIGTKYYDHSKNNILKAEWHPLSETSTHIAVLGTDSALRLFNIGEDIDEPEQTFDLSPVDKTNVSYPSGGISLDDIDDQDEDAVTFSFSNSPSKKESGWETFTVYYALRNGHIYSLCPFLPYKSIVQREHLDNLSCVAQVKQIKAQKENSPLSHLYELQCQWVEELLESAKKAQDKNSRLSTTDALTIYGKGIDNYEVQQQGPFLISQSETLPQGSQPTDIFYTNVDGIGLIALALSNGVVQNYILGGDVEAQWQMPVKTAKEVWQRELAHILSSTGFLPRATLYEEVNLKPAHFTSQQKLKIVKNSLREDMYLVYHAGGVTSVMMTEWLNGLKKLTESQEKGATSGIADWLNNSKGSEASVLINSAPLSTGSVPIIGLAHIVDHYLSYSLLAITGDFSLVSREWNIRRTDAQNASTTLATKTQLSHIAGDDQRDESSYQCLLSLPAFTVPEQLTKLPKQSSIVAPKSTGKEIVINNETLTFFSKSTEQIRRDAREIKSIGSKIANRIVVQQKEFVNQVEHTRLINDRIQAYCSGDIIKEKQEKIKKIMEEHAKLQLRMDGYLRQLMDTYQPELSDEEKDWIKKLEELKQKIEGSGGYESRIALLKDQLNSLNEKVGSPSKSVIKANSANKVQLKSILRSAKEKTTSIENVKETIEALTSKLESTKV